MFIYVEALTGLKLRFNVSPEDKIERIKNKIMICQDIPSNEQHLIYQYQELENDKTLESYGIQHNSTIRLIMKLKGGPLSVDVDCDEVFNESSPNSSIDQLAIIFLEDGELRFLPISGLEMQSKLLKQTKDDLNDQSIFSSIEEPVTDQKLTILKLKMDCIRLGKKLSNMARQENSKAMQVNPSNSEARPNRPQSSVLHRSVSLDLKPTELTHQTPDCPNKYKTCCTTGYSSKCHQSGIFRTMSVMDTIKLNKCSFSTFPPLKSSSEFSQKSKISESVLNDLQMSRNSFYETRQRLPPLSESEYEHKKNITRKPRCPVCLKKMSLLNDFTCRCGSHFCSKHKYPEEHSCKYDYRFMGKQELIRSNPLIEAKKIAKI